MPAQSSSHPRIYDVVRQIPAGHVLTYGEVAALAGLPRHARLVGYALHALPRHTAVPWQRVVNARGGISTGRAYPGGDLVQRRLLEAEGVEFDANGRIPMERFRWRPGAETIRERFDDTLADPPTEPHPLPVGSRPPLDEEVSP